MRIQQTRQRESDSENDDRGQEIVNDDAVDRCDLAVGWNDSHVCMIASMTYEWFKVDQRAGLFTSESDSGAYGNGEFVVKNVTMFHVPVQGSNLDQGSAGREPSFYIYVITIPCFLLTFLSIVGCFWTTNVKERQLEKLAIALTSMMSMTTFVDMVSQQMPKTNDFPLLGTFVLICVFITSAACVFVGQQRTFNLSTHTSYALASAFRFVFDRRYISCLMHRLYLST
ncbi:unnamed protein product, partial [Mesorhabditis belari]|uniref:Neurotransmitter-gated ion-channel transmembrane domain-containing protein n=1 Tax=Mesorhabditis belari TaxID=2138241 RepID=A0AAF3F8Q2_9BILA